MSDFKDKMHQCNIELQASKLKEVAELGQISYFSN